MDEFGVLVESIGFRANGKSAPLAKLKPQPRSHFPVNTTSSLNDSSSLPVDELDGIFRSNVNVYNARQTHDFLGGDDLFGGPFSSSNNYGGIDLQSVLGGSTNNRRNESNLTSINSVSSDAYDDLLGLKSKQSDPVEDLFGSFGATSSKKQENKGPGSDDLLPGFGGTAPSKKGEQTGQSPQSSGRQSGRNSTVDDPFLVFESSASKPDASWPFTGPSKRDAQNGSVHSVIDELDDFAKVRGKNNTGTHGISPPPSNKNAGTGSNIFDHTNDLDAFFNAGIHQKHGAKPTSAAWDSEFDIFFHEEKKSEVKKNSSQSSFSSNKPSSVTNIGDDFGALFGDVAPSSGEFQEIEGEPEERRRARLNRHIRMNTRMAEALAEKNQRDLQSQQEQEEKRRIAETLDYDIKRWAAGKEGNLRALLSSLQQVLWPECGWRPVSLTDMITSDSVKKIYKKATLYVHPDKVQQKGATIQQKYIAEKVFDLLKEAWNKFSAEELR